MYLRLMILFKKALLVILGGMCIAYRTSATVLPCAENRTDICIENLATFTTLDKPTFTSENELGKLCREADNGQRCSSDYLRSPSCFSSEDQLRIKLQIGRSQDVSLMLCNSGGYIADETFKKLYLKYESCIDEHKKKIKECYASSGVMEDPEFEIFRNSSKTDKDKHITVCCPLVQYIECTENAIRTSCGSESKDVVLRVLMKVSGKQLEAFCKNVDPKFPSSPMACVNSAIQKVAFFIVYLAMFALYLMF